MKFRYKNKHLLREIVDKDMKSLEESKARQKVELEKDDFILSPEDLDYFEIEELEEYLDTLTEAAPATALTAHPSIITKIIESAKVEPFYIFSVTVDNKHVVEELDKRYKENKQEILNAIKDYNTKVFDDLESLANDKLYVKVMNGKYFDEKENMEKIQGRSWIIGESILKAAGLLDVVLTGYGILQEDVLTSYKNNDKTQVVDYSDIVDPLKGEYNEVEDNIYFDYQDYDAWVITADNFLKKDTLSSSEQKQLNGILEGYLKLPSVSKILQKNETNGDVIEVDAYDLTDTFGRYYDEVIAERYDLRIPRFAFSGNVKIFGPHNEIKRFLEETGLGEYCKYCTPSLDRETVRGIKMKKEGLKEAYSNRRELVPKQGSVRSYYGKATIINKGQIAMLVSYSTPVCIYDGNYGDIYLGDLYDTSQTTLRHVKEFLYQMTGKYYSIKELREINSNEETKLSYEDWIILVDYIQSDSDTFEEFMDNKWPLTEDAKTYYVKTAEAEIEGLELLADLWETSTSSKTTQHCEITVINDWKSGEGYPKYKGKNIYYNRSWEAFDYELALIDTLQKLSEDYNQLDSSLASLKEYASLFYKTMR